MSLLATQLSALPAGTLEVAVPALGAGLVAVLATVAVERLGGAVGGVVSSIPTTIVPAALGIHASAPDEDSFRRAMCFVPVGILLNAGYLLLWRVLPARIGMRSHRHLLATTAALLGDVHYRFEPGAESIELDSGAGILHDVSEAGRIGYGFPSTVWTFRSGDSAFVVAGRVSPLDVSLFQGTERTVSSEVLPAPAETWRLERREGHVLLDLRVTFPSRQGVFEAVRGVSFDLGRERLGVVGESGSGKSMTGRAILGLVRPPGRVTRTNSATAASLAMPAFSMALSSPSEYEKPPTGSAGEASQMSCSRLAAGKGAGWSGGMAGVACQPLSGCARGHRGHHGHDRGCAHGHVRRHALRHRRRPRVQRAGLALSR